ncbi:MAG TPA: peptidoglycan DD-metalloendopeptidase family protein [Thermoanaerobaculia bacterium]|nr:peptidoglycan DD-metalloendopeptidase family protein [Thermoanaerobaculia bacterium]
MRRRRVFMAAALPIAIPLIFAAVRTEPLASSTAEPALIAPDLRYEDLRTVAPAELPEHSFILTVEPNDTLDAVFTAGGLSRRDSAVLTAGFGQHLDLRRLRPGHLVRFHRDRAGEIDAVQMRVSGWGDINALRNDGGMFDVTAREAEQRSVATKISAKIDSSLYEAIRSAGEDAPLVQQLVDVFQWDIDFFSLQKGDTFSVIVEKKYAGNDPIGYGPVLAARFVHAGETYEAFRHEAPDGRGGYYTAQARPLRKQFLRAPLHFTRITSGFSKRRFHPVLNYFRPHYGVDYGAPVGTPVMTTADGVVVEARYKRAEGNFIRIKHTSKIETAYLHLSKFAKGIKPGTKVIQGDVIGYVGSTGLATGAHLDYRVREAGKWLDPLKLKSITPDPLRGASLEKFRRDVATHRPQLAHENEAVADAGPRRRALF